MVNGFDGGTAGSDAYEAFVATLADRDRRNVRNQVAACEVEPTADHVTLWKRLACSLATLTNRAAKTTGKRAVQFFAADGDYLMQMFALEDPRDGTLIVYAPDALEAAEAAGVIRGPVRTAGNVLFYEVAGVPGLNVQVEVLSASRTSDAPDYYRHLLGWNRRALKITLQTTAGRAQVSACEALCRIAARRAVVGVVPGVAAPSLNAPS